MLLIANIESIDRSSLRPPHRLSTLGLFPNFCPMVTAQESVLRRYTPPTCTLEIAAKQSPLSRWTGKLALKNLRFRLSFDDPRVSDDQWVTLRGDRNQLEALSDAVASYVQRFLSQSSTASEAVPVVNPIGIALQPKGLLSHELSLGSLATETSGAAIPLTSTQLADLASALDEYAAEATALPNLVRPAWLQSPNWAAIAAGGLVAVGIGASLIQGLDRQKSATTATAPSPSSADQRLALQPPVAPSPSPPLLGPVPLASLPALPGAAPIAPPPIAPSAAVPNGIPSTIPNVTVNQTAQPAPASVSVNELPAPAQANLPRGLDSIGNGSPVAPLPGSSTLDKQRAIEKSAGNLSAAKAEPAAPDPAPPPIADAVKAAARAQESPSLDLNQEVQAAFGQSWRPPAGLTDSLQYRVEVAADGTLQSIEAFNEAARSRSEIMAKLPLVGSKLTAPLKGGTGKTLQVYLDPNGQVRALTAN
jgi:hypothetical protein